ncbi:MAG: PEP-CTERM sorting domain-containing protein [Planctomycetia bacterium]|nr:PEP-CTERM sorting domain-containing protein [Planctomycetia bacterium]
MRASIFSFCAIFGVFLCFSAHAVIPTTSLPGTGTSTWTGFDVNLNNDTANETGFTPLTGSTSDKIFSATAPSGITLTVENNYVTNSIRDRNSVSGFTSKDPYYNLYRDFIYNNGGNNATSADTCLNISLTELKPNTDYIVRFYGYDNSDNQNVKTYVYQKEGLTGTINLLNKNALAVIRNTQTSPQGAYADITLNSGDSSALNFVLAQYASGISLFNGLEIVEKPAYQQLMKIDLAVTNTSNLYIVTNLTPTFTPYNMSTNMSTKLDSDFNFDVDENALSSERSTTLLTIHNDTGITAEISATGTKGGIRLRSTGSSLSSLNKDLLFIQNGTVDLSLSGLTAGQQYELILYSYDPAQAYNYEANTSSRWSFVSTDTEGNETLSTFKNQQWSRSDSASESLQQFSVYFTPDSDSITIRGDTSVGGVSSLVFLNGFELNELADNVTRVDINHDSNVWRPIAGRFEEMVISNSDDSNISTMTTRTGIGVTITTDADNSARCRTNLGAHSLDQVEGEFSRALMQDFIFANEKERLTLQLDNLIPGNNYELTLYSQDLDVSNNNIGTVNWYLGTELLDENLFGSISLNEGTSPSEEWEVTGIFTALADSILLTAFSENTVSILNGFVLTDLGPSFANLPEPSTMVLFLLGGCLGYFTLRRNRYAVK